MNFRAIVALMQIPGTLSGSPASSLAVPGRQCIRYDVVKKCVCNFSDMQRLQERPARRWESCRPVFPTALRAHAQEGFRHSDAPEGISGTHNQEQWLDHLLQAVEMLLVVLLAAGQFPAARTVWQDLRKSTHSADKETATAKVYGVGATLVLQDLSVNVQTYTFTDVLPQGRLQLVLDHHYPVQQASIVQVGSILGLAGVLLINWILRRRISCRSACIFPPRRPFLQGTMGSLVRMTPFTCAGSREQQWLPLDHLLEPGC